MQATARSRRTFGRPPGMALAYLRAWRAWAGLSQTELAIRAGVCRMTVGHIEAHPHGASRQTLAGLAEALGVPLEMLQTAPDANGAEEWATSLAIAFARERAASASQRGGELASVS
jgi:transcriptional regulator with XRE-family HTH domain